MDNLTHKKRILFVDDEPNLLSGLQRSLRGQRFEWEMIFAASGEEALSIVNESPINAIVTDMWMPGMDGAHLLREIARTQPLSVRLVLSGHSDENSILNLIGTAHQFLAKPCKVELLISVLSRALALQEYLTSPPLQALVLSLDSLPSIPSVYVKLTQMIKNKDTTLRDIGRTISSDPAITAKLLQVVNSSFFGVGRRISSPEEAVVLLGIDTIKGIALTTDIFHQFDCSGHTSLKYTLDNLWKHSVAVASLAREIAKVEKCNKTTIEEAVTAGLLHDIGILLLAFQLPDTWDDVLRLAQSDNIHHWVAEARITGATHNAIGAYLLGIWGLPQPIVEAVAYNHTPLMSSDNHKFTALSALHFADALIQNDTCLDMEYLRALQLEHRLETWRALSDNIHQEAVV